MASESIPEGRVILTFTADKGKIRYDQKVECNGAMLFDIVSNLQKIEEKLSKGIKWKAAECPKSDVRTEGDLK
jgi:hypothetical protein